MSSAGAQTGERGAARIRLLVWPTLAAVVFLTLGALSVNGTVAGVFGDDAIYLSAGISLAAECDYRAGCLPGSPLLAKYPPLYPALLAFGSVVFPELPGGLAYFKFLTLLTAVPGLYFFFLWARTRCVQDGLPPALSLLLVFLVACHAGTMFFAKEMMSEGLFASLLAAALWQADRASGRSKGCVSAGRWACLLVLGLLMFYTRTIALVFLLCLPLHECLHRRYARAVASAVVIAAGILPWILWTRVWVPANEPMAGVMPYFVGYGYHAQAIREYFASPDAGTSALAGVYAARNCVATLNGLALVSVPRHYYYAADPSTSGPEMLSLVIFALTVVGMFFLLRKRTCTGMHMLGYLFLVAAWPWSHKFRLLVPVAPFILYCCVRAVALPFSKAPRYGRYAAVIACVVMLLFNLSWSAEMNLSQGTLFAGQSGGQQQIVNKDALLDSAAWICDNTPEEAVLLTSEGGFFYHIHTGRAVCPYPTLSIPPGEHLRRMYGRSDAHAPPDFASAAAVMAEAMPHNPLYRVEICPYVPPEAAPSLRENWDAVFEDSAAPGKFIVISLVRTGSAATGNP